MVVALRYAAKLPTGCDLMQLDQLKRREFITLVSGAAVVWPVAARAQQRERMRRIGVLMGWSQNDLYRSWVDVFVQGLAQLGWVDGRNVQIDVRWAGGDVGLMGTFAKELSELQPDVIFAGTSGYCRAATGNPYNPNRVRGCFRSYRSGVRGRTAATRWKHHGVHQRRGHDGGQMVGDTQGDSA
jgi:hypothetical protein